MRSEPLRVGVIGFGKMGLLHASIASGLGVSSLAAVADPTTGVLDPLRRLKPVISVYEDYERMLANESLDAVFITSPTHLHASTALACVSAGLPFLVEKPLSARASDCEPLVAAVARTRLTNAVGYMARHADTFRKAKQIVDSGVLGRLVHLQATMYVSQLFGAGQGWRYDPAYSGGGAGVTVACALLTAWTPMDNPLKASSTYTAVNMGCLIRCGTNMACPAGTTCTSGSCFPN